MEITKQDLVRIHDYLWEIPKSFRKKMKVPARLYASSKTINEIFRDRSLEQLINITALPGIKKYALAMPDIHEGYGFPVGGVGAFGADDGIISPGGIGYDINCGVRLLRCELTFEKISPYLEKLGKALYREIPSGVGRGGRIKMTGEELDHVLLGGAKRAVELGFGKSADLGQIESAGSLSNANPDFVSDHAKRRGQDQLGTMGAGNHFVEVGVVDQIYDQETAKKLKLFEKQITILIHTGSRGLGHQVASDYIKKMLKASSKYGIHLPDSQLACAPFPSREGQQYFQAMSCGANFAWANRQLIAWEVGKVWREIFGTEGKELDIVYDVAHNIAKIEEYEIDGKKTKTVVHRKGATRAFEGQPVIIPGTMGTGSYVLLGSKKSMEESFGSSCHGAGRRMSRREAKREVRADELKKRLKARGIVVNVGSLSGLAEEAPEAYKNVDEVVNIIHRAGIAAKIAHLKPLVVIKG